LEEILKSVEGELKQLILPRVFQISSKSILIHLICCLFAQSKEYASHNLMQYSWFEYSHIEVKSSKNLKIISGWETYFPWKFNKFSTQEKVFLLILKRWFMRCGEIKHKKDSNLLKNKHALKRNASQLKK
jgi:hypothetical protein